MSNTPQPARDDIPSPWGPRPDALAASGIERALWLGAIARLPRLVVIYMAFITALPFLFETSGERRSELPIFLAWGYLMLLVVAFWIRESAVRAVARAAILGAEPPGLWRQCCSFKHFWFAALLLIVFVPGFIKGWPSANASADSDSSSFTVERIDDSMIRLFGVIDERSAKEVLEAFKDPKVERLWITSPGGLAAAARSIAAVVNARGIEVIGDEYCLATCIDILVASPAPAVYADAVVTFHQPQPNPEGVGRSPWAPTDAPLREWLEYFHAMGLAEWAMARMWQSEFWTPALGELVDMNLVTTIYDPKTDDPEYAEHYCEDEPRECETVDRGPEFAFIPITTGR